MKLHEDKDVFEELVLTAADSMGLPQAYVEKDYWVTWVLANLAASSHCDDFVFKGGTSLSKVHGLIHRFSEDVDLAVCNTKWGGSKRRKRLKAVGKDITVEEIQSLVAEYLIGSGNAELVERYELQPFRLKVLDVQRTAAEKVIALVRASREGGDESYLKLRIRHVYDLCMIFRNEEHVQWLDNQSFERMLVAVCDADRRVFAGASAWLDEPLHEAPLFAEPRATWALVAAEFEGPFSKMVYGGDLPDSDEIVQLLERLGDVLERLASP